MLVGNVCYTWGVPNKHHNQQTPGFSVPGRDSVRCSALTATGDKCRKRAVPGLRVCSSHGGGTGASVRASKRKQAHTTAHALWGISPDTGNVNIVEELQKLARNKMTDITAIRLELGGSADDFYGMLEDSREITENEVNGRTVKRSRKAGVHPLVTELHKAEGELVQILKLLKEVTGNTDESDISRIRLQTARETARLMKAYPGMGVDEAAAEVAKRV